MNFFEAQDDARRRSKWLVLYFLLAILGVIIAVYAVLAVALVYLGVSKSLFMPDVFLITALITGGVMGMGSLFKTMQLNGGGSVVARDMGARQVDPHTTDTDERRLVNIVEEMAIASGLPVPEIWMMDDELSINAFAAGTEPGNAVVAVTRGCLQRLTRDELQGVVAHEFSHILNGDMKLNMRLMGLLFGVLMVSLIGRTLFHSLRFMSFRGSSRENKGGGGIVVAILMVGVGLIIVGSIGVFFGRLIQAAISRQREYLADASAVQFTRDSDGIAGALMKIGGQEYGSSINAPKAAEASHLFFADGGMFSYGLATHPPLDIRIKALQKSWDGEFVVSELPDVAHGRTSHTDARVSGFSGDTPMAPAEAPIAHADMNQIGEPSQIDMGLGRLLHAGLQEHWVHACHDREEAQALIFGLLLAEDNQLKDEEVLFIQKGAGQDAGQLAIKWNHELGELHSSVKIALVDLCIPTLRRLSILEYERFVEITKWLIASDGQVDLFEFMLQRIIQRHLDTHFHHSKHDKIRYRRLDQLELETNVLLTTVSALGGEDQMEAAYQTAVDEYLGDMKILPPSECGLKNVELALEKFDTATPIVKKQLLRLLGLAVMHDGHIESREAELLRATADAIGCTVPPFVKKN